MNRDGALVGDGNAIPGGKIMAEVWVTDLGDACLSTTDMRLFGQQGRMDRWLALVEATWETRAFGDFWQHVLVAEGVLDVAVDPAAGSQPVEPRQCATGTGDYIRQDALACASATGVCRVSGWDSETQRQDCSCHFERGLLPMGNLV